MNQRDQFPYSGLSAKLTNITEADLMIGESVTTPIRKRSIREEMAADTYNSDKSSSTSYNKGDLIIEQKMTPKSHIEKGCQKKLNSHEFSPVSIEFCDEKEEDQKEFSEP